MIHTNESSIEIKMQMQTIYQNAGANGFASRVYNSTIFLPFFSLKFAFLIFFWKSCQLIKISVCILHEARAFITFKKKYSFLLVNN